MGHMSDESEDPGVRVLCAEALGNAVSHGKAITVYAAANLIVPIARLRRVLVKLETLSQLRRMLLSTKSLGPLESAVAQSGVNVNRE